MKLPRYRRRIATKLRSPYISAVMANTLVKKHLPLIEQRHRLVVAYPKVQSRPPIADVHNVASEIRRLTFSV